jgi:hypothetical protein
LSVISAVSEPEKKAEKKMSRISTPNNAPVEMSSNQDVRDSEGDANKIGFTAAGQGEKHRPEPVSNGARVTREMEYTPFAGTTGKITHSEKCLSGRGGECVGELGDLFAGRLLGRRPESCRDKLYRMAYAWRTIVTSPGT